MSLQIARRLTKLKKPCRSQHCGRKIAIHPITAAAFLYRYAFLLIIPILQFIIFRPQDIWEMLRTSGRNVLLAAAVVVYAYVRYKCTFVLICGEKMIAGKGVFFRKKNIIYEKRLVGAALKQGAVTAIFGALTLCVSTGERRLSVEEYIKKKSGALPLFNVKGKALRMSLFYSFVAAADATSALSGLLLVIPFLRKMTPVIGSGLSEGFYGSIDLWSHAVSRLLPPAAAYVSGFIAVGYCFAFIYELLKHLKMQITHGEEAVKISRGFIWSVVSVQLRSEISALTIEQGLLCMALGIKKVFMVSHLNKSLGSERELFAVKKGRLKKPESNNLLKPKPGSLFSFMLLPFLCFAVSVGFAFYFQSVGRDITVMIIMSTAVPFFLLLLLRAAAFEQTFLRIDDKGVFAGTYSGLRLVQVYAERSKINGIEVRQNLFQKIFGSCNIRIYTNNRRKAFAVKRLKLSEVMTILRKN